MSTTGDSLTGILFIWCLIWFNAKETFIWDFLLYFSFIDKKNGDLLNLTEFPPCYRSFLAVST